MPRKPTYRPNSKPVNMALWRCIANCRIGKAVFNGEEKLPDGCSATEYAIYLLLSAVEDLAAYFEEKETKEHE